MNTNIMAVCDSEEAYAYHLSEYISMKKAMPFQLQIFTGKELLFHFCKKNQVELLVIAESLYGEDIKKLPVRYTVILADAGLLQVENALIVNKYQSSEKIIREIMRYYGKCAGNGGLTSVGKQTRLIGIYTPVGRCLQTSFALLLGEVLAKEKDVLYLNFEPYSGFGKFMKKEFSTGLTDAVYYLKNTQEKFIYKFGSMVQSVNGLDFIPPAFSFLDLSSVSKEDWLLLLHTIEKECNYDYIIMDLSDNIQGLFDILRLCRRIYTITREDGMAAAKIDQYEKLLTAVEYEDIKGKTKRFRLPYLKNIPMEIEQLPFCQLAKYVNAIVKEDLNL